MYVPYRATFELPPPDCIVITLDQAEDADPTGCLAEARFSLDDALDELACAHTAARESILQSCLTTAELHIRRAMSALPGGA